MSPLPDDSIGKASTFPPTAEMQTWFQSGLELVSQNKVAALLLAGGQVRATSCCFLPLPPFLPSLVHRVLFAALADAIHLSSRMRNIGPFPSLATGHPAGE